MDGASIVGIHVALDSLSFYKVVLLGDLLLKWQLAMPWEFFPCVFLPHASLALLLYNAN
jgi:hypothetical protein